MAGPDTWALVSNGVRARILRGLETGDSKHSIELISKSKSTHLRDIMADQAGRSFASYGSGRRSAMEPGSDPILRDMQDFARETLSFLELHYRARDFRHLAIVASPKMLGILRQEMPPTLKDSVILEYPSNLVQLPQAELREGVLKLLKAERASKGGLPT